MLSGNLEIQIGLAIAQLKQQMAEATRIVNKGMGDISTAISWVRRGFALIGVGLTFDWIKNMVTQTLRATDELGDLATKTGATIGELQALKDIATENGKSFELATMGLTRLSRAMTAGEGAATPAARALKFLNIETKNADGTMKSTAQVLMDMAKKLAEYRDGAGKTALAIDVWGRSGASLLPMLKDMAEKGELNAAAMEEQQRVANQYVKAIGAVKVQWEEFWRTFAVTIAPGLNMVSGIMRDSMKELNKQTKANTDAMVDWAGEAVASIAAVIEALKMTITIIKMVIEFVYTAGYQFGSLMKIAYGAWLLTKDPARSFQLVTEGWNQLTSSGSKWFSNVQKDMDKISKMDPSGIYDKYRAKAEAWKKQNAIARTEDFQAWQRYDEALGNIGKQELDWTSGRDRNRGAGEKFITNLEKEITKLKDRNEQNQKAIEVEAQLEQMKKDGIKVDEAKARRLAAEIDQLTLAKQIRADLLQQAVAEEQRKENEEKKANDAAAAIYNQLSAEEKLADFQATLVGLNAAERQALTDEFAIKKKIDELVAKSLNADPKVIEQIVRRTAAKTKETEVSEKLLKVEREWRNAMIDLAQERAWIGLSEEEIAVRKRYYDIEVQIRELAENDPTFNADAERRRRTAIADQQTYNEALKQQVGWWENLADAASRFFIDILDKGKSALDTLRDLVRRLITEFLAFMLKKWVLQITANILGSFTGGMGAGTVAGGLMNTANTMSLWGMTGGPFGLGGLGSSSFLWGSPATAGGWALSEAGMMYSPGTAATSGLLGGGGAPAWLGTLGTGLGILAGLYAISQLFSGRRGGPKTGGSWMGEFDASGRYIGPSPVPGSDNGRFYTPSGLDPMMEAGGKALARTYYETVKGLGGTGRGLIFGLGGDIDVQGTASSRVSGYVKDPRTGMLFTDLNRDVGRIEDLGPELQTEASRMLLAALQATEFPEYVKKLFGSVDAMSASKEQVEGLIKQALALRQIMEIAERDPFADIAQALKDAENPFQSAVETYTESIREVMDAYDGSAESTEALSSATASYYDSMMKLLLSIEEVKASVKGLFESATRTVTMTGMSDEEKYKYLQEEARRAREMALQSTDPNAIQRYSQQWVQDMMDAWALLSPEQQALQKEGYLAALRGGQAEMDAHLTAIQTQAANDMKDILREIKDAIGNSDFNQQEAASDNKDAANIQLEAANKNLTAANTAKRFAFNFENYGREVTVLGN